MSKIKSITCQKILNSRGDWTIETKVTLDDGSEGVQAIPDGASKGENEAVYIPVEKAVDIVSTAINDVLEGEDPAEQFVLDQILLDMDGTTNKKHLGGNSILSVSLAAAKATGLSSYGINNVPAASTSTATCNHSAAAWAAEVPLKAAGANQMWCVDSTGASKQKSASIGAATAC